MAEPLHGPWMPTSHFRKGRGRMRWGRVIFLGAHTAEGGSSSRALGDYFRNTAKQVSSHCGIGQAGDYAEYVHYGDTAWTMPPVNDDSENCELLGFAAWSRAEWMHHPKMLDAFARWLAWRGEVRHIPLRVLSAAEAHAGKPGILMHRTANAAFHGSDHTDPGRNLPWDYVLGKAEELDMPSTDEIRKIIREELARKEYLAAVGEAVLNTDGEIVNNYTTDHTNEFVTAKTALSVLGERTKPKA